MSFLRWQREHKPASWPFPPYSESMAHQSIEGGRERENSSTKSLDRICLFTGNLFKGRCERKQHKAGNTLKAEPSGVPNKAEEMPSNICLCTVPNYFQLASSSLSKRPLPATSNLSPASRRQASTENALLTGTLEG